MFGEFSGCAAVKAAFEKHFKGINGTDPETRSEVSNLSDLVHRISKLVIKPVIYLSFKNLFVLHL